MSTVQVDQSHKLGQEAAKKALDGFISELGKYGMSLVWKSAHEGELKGTGASGSVRVTDTNVSVTVKLGMIAKAAGVKADKLQASIEKRLKTALDV